jgi:hypothetical protein
VIKPASGPIAKSCRGFYWGALISQAPVATPGEWLAPRWIARMLLIAVCRLGAFIVTAPQRRGASANRELGLLVSCLSSGWLVAGRGLFVCPVPSDQKSRATLLCGVHCFGLQNGERRRFRHSEAGRRRRWRCSVGPRVARVAQLARGVSDRNTPGLAREAADSFLVSFRHPMNIVSTAFPPSY